MARKTEQMDNMDVKKSEKIQVQVYLLIIGIFVGTIAGFLLASMLVPGQAPAQKLMPTGRFLIAGGSTTSTGEQTTANPDDGAIKGTLAFVIVDPETNETVSTEYGSNWTLYFGDDDYEIGNWSLVKDDTSEYLGSLTNVDADGNDTICAGNNYTTTNYYYDTNDDDAFNLTEGSGEFSVYRISTDVLGCFSSKLPVGNYSIYA